MATYVRAASLRRIPESSILGKRRRRDASNNLDRFIPNPSAMDWDYAHYMLTESRDDPLRRHQNLSAYQFGLAEVFNMNRRILPFNSHSQHLPKPLFKPPRKISPTPDRVLSAPDLLHDFPLNLLDWGPTALAIALTETVYLWGDKSISQLLSASEDVGPVTSLSWSPGGSRIAVGFNNSHVQIWDATSNKRIRTLQGAHTSRVGSLAWKNNSILTSGGMDGVIVNNDTRIRDQIIQRYQGHSQEVCGLKWSPSGQQLASGGEDKLIHIWDQSVASSNSPSRWFFRFREHTAAVKALAWCPFQSKLLASGGGTNDASIKFWNTQTGACLNSVDTGSQVSGLLWNNTEKELLSCHGYSQNNLTLWKYPSMTKTTELIGHTDGILHMTQSPNGCTVATAAADNTMRLWNVFGTPGGSTKPVSKSKTKSEPFSHATQIR